MMVKLDRDGQPLYVRVAHVLSQGIANNQFPVGGLLPTEAELSEKFGVSRHTVREAIRHLRSQGLLSARRGVGTRVESGRSSVRYTHAVHSLSELWQRAAKVTIEVAERAEVVADAKVAEQVGTKPGKELVLVAGMMRDSDGSPLCWTDIYLDRMFSGVAQDIGTLQIPTYKLVEQRYGEIVTEVKQEISAAFLPAKYAAKLNAQPNAPALLVTWRYFGAGGRLLGTSLNLHPGDRFTYTMTLKLDSN